MPSYTSKHAKLMMFYKSYAPFQLTLSSNHYGNAPFCDLTIQNLSVSLANLPVPRTHLCWSSWLMYTDHPWRLSHSIMGQLHQGLLVETQHYWRFASHTQRSNCKGEPSFKELILVSLSVHSAYTMVGVHNITTLDPVSWCAGYFFAVSFVVFLAEGGQTGHPTTMTASHPLNPRCQAPSCLQILTPLKPIGSLKSEWVAIFPL